MPRGCKITQKEADIFNAYINAGHTRAIVRELVTHDEFGVLPLAIRQMYENAAGVPYCKTPSLEIFYK